MPEAQPVIFGELRGFDSPHGFGVHTGGMPIEDQEAQESSASQSSIVQPVLSGLKSAA
jgi:hypothetical protein